MEPQKELSSSYLPSPPIPSQKSDDEIDFRMLFKALWKGKWLIIATTSIFSLAALFYAINLPNIYKADALLSPAETSSSGDLSKMAGQLGGLAALAGVNLGSSDSSQTDLAVQVMKSRKFIRNFIQKHDLLVPLMAGKKWDLETNTLILDNDIYDPTNNEWLRDPDGLRGPKPSNQEAFEVFREDVFSISEDVETGLYTVSVKYYSPYIAQQWVNWLIEDINKVMRERTISESTQNLDYLNKQLEKTSVADMQSTFYKLIEEQTKSLMLAEVQEEFVFKTVDPAIAPDVKHAPSRALICALGALVGGILGLVIILATFLFKKEELNNVESPS
ncbi:Wzz/FepE/Etk N-terminal domain-containing protein [Vibrio parahaemolyticus]|nr:Wzz/FepE/Etk N-terminal domain-containing protein [Vibrio parahaemolyticus]EGR3402183.1 LPS O-antigen length regulator [Vibrio parahaemolyticus]EHR6474863.1 LPS O-antigen length regulator [Vibrio parahaemolyticus]EJE4166503.1 LPS O-antigen length regulator [Vibrio parahaemolyticus]ELB2160760.1 LPS O-antigen length regulator [Vibrio parahaemolyticus]KHF17943.1 lipopolysaccharide biosynthesis protein [Vibrio parahaemolyticus]